MPTYRVDVETNGHTRPAYFVQHRDGSWSLLFGWGGPGGGLHRTLAESVRSLARWISTFEPIVLLSEPYAANLDDAVHEHSARCAHLC